MPLLISFTVKPRKSHPSAPPHSYYDSRVVAAAHRSGGLRRARRSGRQRCALDNSGGGVAPETLASSSRLDCSTDSVRRHLIDLLATGYVEGRYGRCPETGFPRQSFLPNTVVQPASDVY